MNQIKNILTPEEVTIIQLALQGIIDDCTDSLKSKRLNKEGEFMSKDMMKVATSALEKIAKSSGHLVKMDPYTPGDEKEFLKPKE